MDERLKNLPGRPMFNGLAVAAVERSLCNEARAAEIDVHPWYTTPCSSTKFTCERTRGKEFVPTKSKSSKIRNFKMLAGYSAVSILRSTRDDLLARNPEIVETQRAVVHAKVARFRAVSTIEQLQDEKASRAVWVPPSKHSASSSSANTNASKNKTTRSVQDLESKLRSAKTNARLHTRELRHLVLKRAFLVWRAMSVVRGEIERKMELMEGDIEVEMAERAIEAWRVVAEPWVYDESVLESADLFRLVSTLGLQNRLMQYWRLRVARRKDLEARREVFEEHVAGRVIKDAMVHWKVYRLVHHLDRGRTTLAEQFDRVRRLKAVFVHLRDRARRRVLLQERMEVAVFPRLRPQPTVDDLLSLGEASAAVVISKPYAVLNERLCVTMDVEGEKTMLRQLKSASAEMGRLVRWADLRDVEWFPRCGERKARVAMETIDVTGTMEPSEAVNMDGAKSEADEAAAISELDMCRKRMEVVLAEQENVLAEISKLSGSKLPRLQRKQDVAMRNLSECEKVMSDMESVSQRLARQLDTATHAVLQCEADNADAAGVVDHLEGVHAATASALEAATARLASHADERAKIDDKIEYWQAKIREHMREVEGNGITVKGGMNGKSRKVVGKSITAAVQLEEARDRLRRAEARRIELDGSYNRLTAVKQDAAEVEHRARGELARSRHVAKKASASLTLAKEKADGLREQHAQLEQDYSGLVPCLEKLLAAVEESDVAADAAFARAMELDTRHEALDATLKEMRDNLRLLKERKAAEEAEEDAFLAAKAALALDQVVPESVDDTARNKAAVLAAEYPVTSPLMSSSTTMWGNESYGYHLRNQRPGRPMIPGDRLLLRSADSYHVLTRARSCLGQWRVIVGENLNARQEAYRRFVSHVAPGPLAAWRDQARDQIAARELWNDRRVLTSTLSVWKRTAHESRRENLLVASCRAVSSSRTLERVLSAWKDVIEEEAACLDAAQRRDIVVRARVFAFWRTKTAHSVDLRSRLAPVCERKDAELSKATFACWRQATRNRLTLRRVFDAALEVWSQRVEMDAYFHESNSKTVQGDCVDAWSLVVHQAREARRLDAIHDVIKRSHEHCVLRRTFQAFLATVQCQRDQREDAVQGAIATRDALLLRRAFYYLFDWAAHRVLASAKLQVKWSYDHPLRTAIIAWTRAMEVERETVARLGLCDKLRRVIACKGVGTRDHVSEVVGEAFGDAVSHASHDGIEAIKSTTYNDIQRPTELSLALHPAADDFSSPSAAHSVSVECTAISL